MDSLPLYLLMLAMLLISGLIVYLLALLSEKRLNKALHNNSYKRTKSVGRARIFEAMWMCHKIDEYKTDKAINAVIGRYGMGNLKWGHIHWVYDQVRSAGAVEISSMPSERGI